MLALTTIAALATTAISIAIPQGGDSILVPSDTSVWYYQAGGWPNSIECLDHVANGTLVEGVCTCLDYAGLGIFQSPSNDCSLTVYEGTNVCGADATSKTTTRIPAGNSLTCVNTDVDAGLTASGVWACG
ncbi:hypothetical protein LTR86_003581 [Recurvomyces mirabilis]|nr:hypothetical protein LTR86_003581 [Recurvomyces mirabilis]